MLTQKEIIRTEIIALMEAGKSYSWIAEYFGMTRGAVAGVVYRYKHKIKND